MTYIKGNDRNLILVRGVSGSGKSEFVDFIFPTSLVISTDDFFMNGDNYEFDKSLLSENHAKCLKSVETEMDFPTTDMGFNIIVHNTFTQSWEMKPYEELADKYGYNFYTIIVENRHKSDSIHDVPEDVIDAQKKRFEVIL